MFVVKEFLKEGLYFCNSSFHFEWQSAVSIAKYIIGNGYSAIVFELDYNREGEIVETVIWTQEKSKEKEV